MQSLLLLCITEVETCERANQDYCSFSSLVCHCGKAKEKTVRPLVGLSAQRDS